MNQTAKNAKTAKRNYESIVVRVLSLRLGVFGGLRLSGAVKIQLAWAILAEKKLFLAGKAFDAIEATL
jgi:hypothetical protein